MSALKEFPICATIRQKNTRAITRTSMSSLLKTVHSMLPILKVCYIMIMPSGVLSTPRESAVSPQSSKTRKTVYGLEDITTLAI